MAKFLRKLLVYSLLFALFMSCLSLYHWQSKLVNYSKLNKLLAAHEWMQADRETSYIFGAIIRKKIEERESSFWGASRLDGLLKTMRSKYMEDTGICCKDLQTIDRLWSDYSNGQFGFTIQAKIALSMSKITLILGEKREQITTHELINRISLDSLELSQKFGWKEGSQLTYSDKFKDPSWYRVAQNPGEVPGFLPSPQWIIEEVAGKFRYEIGDAIKDFLRCGKIQINDSIPVVYISKTKEIESFENQLSYLQKKNNYLRTLKRQNCKT